MATAPSNAVVRFVRQLAGPPQLAAGLPDHGLLARFAHDRDEAAFAALVRRHGPLVLAVCRRVLGDWHAAEDCLQQTFLVLAAKAGCLERPEALGPWLHGVAVRTALKARARARRRRRQEERVARGPAVEQPDDLAWRDLRPVLDEAILALDERHRAPFVLHYLEGATVAEVARRLGCPPGTVSARLARAKERLRARLARRGVSLSAGALAAAVFPQVASAGLPNGLAEATATAAIRRAGVGAVPAWLTTFTREAQNAMGMSKARGAVLALASLSLAGAGALTYWAPAAEQGTAARAAQSPALPKAEGRGKSGGEAPVAGDVERKLRLAFGDDCKDILEAPIRLEFRSLQLVLAARHFAVEPDGRVKFTPCWFARFGGAATPPTTVCCDAAYFTFDQAVMALADLSGRNVITVEPRGPVRVGFGPPPPTARERAEGQLYYRLREHGRLELPQGRCSLTVRGVEGKKLVGPVLKRLDAEGQVEFVTTAREGELLRVDTEKGVVLIRLRSGSVKGRDGSQGEFEEKIFEVPLPNAPDGR